ncbi:hypothetical protein DCS_03411 [Drechmeria coniospora]|uniref:Uncharacterized protein n=1 Tax=Drechmeria coniospora TaxID=98403 RepID=A0A151GH89_DRECN|nr:hypothetical protein DCS_03411 [Drechmeria coniospora]KYK56411.1 hypothetical protein DCS_03411 [Drechmeria coniospora]
MATSRNKAPERGVEKWPQGSRLTRRLASRPSFPSQDDHEAMNRTGDTAWMASYKPCALVAATSLGAKTKQVSDDEEAVSVPSAQQLLRRRRDARSAQEASRWRARRTPRRPCLGWPSIDVGRVKGGRGRQWQRQHVVNDDEYSRLVGRGG